MKKKIFTLLIVLTAISTCAWADVEINETNFPDATFRAYVKKTFQKYAHNGESLLSDDEIAMAKEISVVNQDIRSFKGIEFLTALQVLKCTGNKGLTSLDLSKNVNMQELYCSDCSLTSLTVAAGAYNFKTINCCQNQLRGDKMKAFLNSLPFLMMYGLTAQLFLIDGDDANEGNELIDLGWYTSLISKGWYSWGHVLDNWYDYASFLQLMLPSISIDANKFPDANFQKAVKDKCDLNKDGFLSLAEAMKVKELYVSNLGITSLKGIELFTEITDLYCNDNKLTSLDLSKNTKLTYLYCSWNSLTSLDVSKNTNLLLLWCHANKLTSLDVSKNTKLLYLDSSTNNLTSLDVSKNTELQYLWCHDNNLTSLDVSKNTKLIELVCQNNKINETAMGKLVKSMPRVIGEPGSFVVVDYRGDGNVITTSQVDIAVGKNWNVKAWKGGSDYINYSGIPDGIEVNNREPITNNRYYSLDGHRLEGVPTQKGVYIRNGKKVVVK